jgi:hypothetical protein
MSVKLFQARQPAFQRLQLPLLLPRPHGTSFRLGRGGGVDSWDGPRDSPLFSLNPLDFRQMRKEAIPSQRIYDTDIERILMKKTDAKTAT